MGSEREADGYHLHRVMPAPEGSASAEHAAIAVGCYAAPPPRALDRDRAVRADDAEDAFRQLHGVGEQLLADAHDVAAAGQCGPYCTVPVITPAARFARRRAVIRDGHLAPRRTRRAESSM